MNYNVTYEIIITFLFNKGMCPVALGADGGGSIRIPSSVNGIVGAKGKVIHTTVVAIIVSAEQSDCHLILFPILRLF